MKRANPKDFWTLKPIDKQFILAGLSVMGLFSEEALAISCTKRNFFVGYEVTATGKPNSAGAYFYTVTPLRCSAQGQIIYDSGLGFSEGHELGLQKPENAYSAFKTPYLANMRSFEGTCKLTYIGIHSSYNGLIGSVNLAAALYPLRPAPYTKVFPNPIFAKLSKEALKLKRDGVPNPAGVCTLPPPKKELPKPKPAPKPRPEPWPEPDPWPPDDPKPRACTGNPILSSQGCKIQREVDYTASGNPLLEIARYYDSQSPYHSASSGPRSVGNRWWLGWEASLNTEIEANTLLMLRDNSAILHFKPKSGSTTQWESDPDVPVLLTKTATGWVYQDMDNTLETYNTEGQRVSKVFPDGRALTYAYNTEGQLASITDHQNRTLQIIYNANGLVGEIRDTTGPLVSYGYDADNNLTSATYPDGKQRQYRYTSVTVGGKVEPALLTGITDENGVAYASWTYNPNAQAISSQYAGSVNHYTITYLTNTQGKITGAGITNPLGAQTDYTFQNILGVNNLTSETHPLLPGVARTYVYDTNGNLTRQTDYQGNIATYAYDLTRNLETQRVEASGAAVARTATTQWHAVWRKPLKIASPNKLTTYVYNGDNGTNCAPATATLPGAAGTAQPINVLCSRTEYATNDANGSQGLSAAPVGTPRVWAYTYNAQGQLLTENGPRTDVNDTTTYTYYALNDAVPGRRGQLSTITNTQGHVTSLTDYDRHGNLLTVIDPNGVTTTLAYDARQRLTSRTIGGETTRYQYDAAGQITKITLPDGSDTTYTYDSAKRLTDIQDTLGNRVHYTLDGAGNRVQEDVRDPQGALSQTRRQVYNGLSQLTQLIGAQNQTTHLQYDANGNATRVTDPLNHATAKTYDALNRLIQITDPNNGAIQFTYNGQDRITQVKDPRNLVTAYTIGGLGDTTQTQSPDTGTRTSTFDSAGNTLTQTDAKGQVTTTQYDALNRPTQLTAHDGKKVQYTWDQGANGKGRLSKIEEFDNNTLIAQIQYTYDALGRRLSETQTLNPGTPAPIVHTQSNTYANGQLKTHTLPSGRALTYTYNAAGQVAQVALTSIAPNAGQTTLLAREIAYYPSGNVKSWTDGAGKTHTRAQDQDGRTSGYTLGDTHWLISFDAAGRIVGQAASNNAAASASYAYDALDRLTGAQLPATSYGYGYDMTGNRTSQIVGGTTQTYTIAPTSNRLQSVSGTPAASYTYDATGNVTNDSQAQYAYDALGRLKQTTAGSLVTDYRVNALGQRVRKARNGAITHYHYDSLGHLVAESNASGAVQREYVWLGHTPIAAIQ